MPNIPIHISLLFIALVFVIAVFFIVTIYIYSKRAEISDSDTKKNVATSILFILGWLMYTVVLTQTGLLADFHARPPRVVFLVVPPLFAIAIFMYSKRFMDVVGKVDQFWLIYPQSYRIVVEVILVLLYRYGVIPRQMTFEGFNFDILAGITAPVVAYYCFRKKTWSPKIALVWNVVALLLLINIMVIAVLSTPYRFRYFMNDPPNLLPFSFPFVWLPSFVVPFGILLHLLSIRQLLSKPAIVRPKVI